jgi:heat shock protein HtpX
MFELVRKNRNKSIILVVFMMLLLAAIGFAAGELVQPGTGGAGVAIAVVVGVIMFLVSFYAGDSVLLAAAGAHEVTKAQAPQLFNIVEEMVIASGLGKMPRVYVIDSTAANAFATGRKPEVSAVAVTDGLLNMLNREELQAVIAHEIAHVKNRDILFMTLLAVMAGAIALISHFITRHLFWFGGGRRSRSSSAGGGQAQLVLFLVAIALIIVGAIVARLVYFAASRTREYMADAGSAIFTRNPAALASALEKISGAAAGSKLPIPKVARPLLIVGASLFETHPPIDKRIAILRGLAQGSALSYSEYAARFTAITGKKAGFVPRSALQESAVSPAAAGKGMVQRVATAAATVAAAKAALPAAAATAARAGVPAAAVAAAAVAGAPGAATPSLRREVMDAVKKNAGYEIVSCRCGAKIKIPANYPRRDRVRCLACGQPLPA